MAHVVLREQQSATPVHRPIECRAELIREYALLEQLVLDPHRKRLPERGESPWSECKIGLQQTLELQERLVIEGHEIDLVGTQPRVFQAEHRCVRRKLRVVLVPRESLLLCGRDDFAVDHQCGCCVVIVGGNAQDPHRARTPRPLRTAYR